MSKFEKIFDESHCEQCACGEGLDFQFSFAFQPIVDVSDQSVYAYEALVRNVHAEPNKQAVVNGVITTVNELGGRVVAEGVETEEEYRWLRSRGITLYQGYLFARPGFETLPEPWFPEYPV